MRVLGMFHAYVPFHGAGAEGMAHALLRHLARNGHQVDVILSCVDNQVPEDYSYEDVRVHAHQGKSQTPNWLANDTRPDVIVCHLENTPRAAVLGKMYEIPVVQMLHNTMPETLWSTLQFRFALLVGNSQWLTEEYQRFWGEYAERTPLPRLIQVRPPVDPAEYGGKPGTRITLMNLTVPKGAHVFYELAKRLPQFKFLGVRGAYGIQVIRDDLPNVQIIDNVPTHQVVQKVYGRSKIVLMPSDYESYGRVAAEATCSGIPVIAHPTAGLREALGEAGIFHDRDDIDAWERALRRLNAPRAWAAASKAALAHARTLDPTAELELWRSAMEEVARVPAAARYG